MKEGSLDEIKQSDSQGVGMRIIKGLLFAIACTTILSKAVLRKSEEKENPCLCPFIIRIPTPWLSGYEEGDVEMWLANSHGVCLHQKGSYCGLFCLALGEKDGEQQSGYGMDSAPNCRAFCKPVFAKSKKFLLILFPTLMILFNFYSRSGNKRGKPGWDQTIR